ncbi:VPLPA-CTERM sorting domain-containing protein [Vibrio sp. PID23_8]|uniref:VPLPA-CTERM sorting domain-containing protein n=1 Tax=Vibrio sp. PID23_8 TaxID=1583767 RepID=UPI000E67DD1F|nr:VPLPA-CTERM sorting domain-containing protein [Vibrio sp. PID23_8]
MSVKTMSVKSAIFLYLGIAFISPAQAGIVYNNWTTNQGESGSYVFTVEHDQANDLFNYKFTVDPWDAEGLGLFIDFGDHTMPGTTAADIGLTNIDPADEVALWATDTTSNDCGQGCNLNGLNPSLETPDDEWELVFRLGAQGFDQIQTFTWTTLDFGLELSDFGLAGVRSQQLCTGDATLPDGIEECTGSDKSYGSRRGTPRSIPEPASTLLLAAGLLGLGMIRRRKVS